LIYTANYNQQQFLTASSLVKYLLYLCLFARRWWSERS